MTNLPRVYVHYKKKKGKEIGYSIQIGRRVTIEITEYYSEVPKVRYKILW